MHGAIAEGLPSYNRAPRLGRPNLRLLNLHISKLLGAFPGPKFKGPGKITLITKTQ